jgi:transcription elongation GreA/GreB family factor
VSVGTALECESETGEKITYKLLGPWDANPEKGIFSFQSKFAQALCGLKKGDHFELQGKKFTIMDIHSAIPK